MDVSASVDDVLGRPADWPHNPAIRQLQRDPHPDGAVQVDQDDGGLADGDQAGVGGGGRGEAQAGADDLRGQ